MDRRPTESEMKAKELLNQLQNNIDNTDKLLQKAENALKLLEENLTKAHPQLEYEISDYSNANPGHTSTETLTLNDRVVWIIGEGQPELGTVKWIGMMHDGLVAGVEFDEAIGNSDGNLDGKQLFNCKYRHGRFVLVRELILWSDFSGERVK